MCIGCKLISPLPDRVCGILGIETGKYLAKGIEVIELFRLELEKNERLLMKSVTSSREYNNRRDKWRQVYNKAIWDINVNSFEWSDVSEDEIVIDYNNQSLQLYTGKIKQKEDDIVQYYYCSDLSSESRFSNCQYFDERFHILNNPKLATKKEIDDINLNSIEQYKKLIK